MICNVNEVMLENERGRDTEGVRVTCSKCQKSEESYGRENKSVKRCLALLNENCDEGNFYVVAGTP